MIDWARGLPTTIGGDVVGWVEASPETKGYWVGLAKSELNIKQCRACARNLHPRRITCPRCGSLELRWMKSTGRGTVYTFSEIFRSQAEESDKSLPYCVGIVLLDEDVYIFSSFMSGDTQSIGIGSRCHVEFETSARYGVLPVFHLDSDSRRDPGKDD